MSDVINGVPREDLQQLVNVATGGMWKNAPWVVRTRALLTAQEQASDNWPRLEKPARVGACVFAAGLSARLVVEAAYRQHQYAEEPPFSDEQIKAMSATLRQPQASAAQSAALPQMPDVDDLANFIRFTDGNHKMGAGALAERIVDWLSAPSAALSAPAKNEAEEALDWIDDFIARCNGDDRGSCESVNVLRRALAAQSAPAGEREPVAYVLTRDGEVCYEADDGIVISNTPGDETDLYKWRPVYFGASWQRTQSAQVPNAPLPHWEPCNPGCDPKFNGSRSRHCAKLCHNAREALAAAPAQPAAQGEFGGAYQGAREDLAIWQRRALEAEARVRQQDQIIDQMGEDLNSINGPTFMGEPVIPAAQDKTSIETALAIKVEKLLCEKLGIEWAPAGMSIESLVDRLAAAQDQGEVQRLREALEAIAADDYETPHDADDNYISRRKYACILRMRGTARAALYAGTNQEQKEQKA